MINELKLVNFQSHEETVLKFHEGINIIIGNSNNGKTGIFRGFWLARYNQPAGEAFISNWARDEKGKQREQMTVTVSKEEGDLQRGKGPDFNGYSLNGKEFTALGKGGLPDEVVTFFNMSEVNIQNQADPSFLLGDSDSKKASFLNTIVDMTEIDIYRSAIDSKKRENNKDFRSTSEDIKLLEQQLEPFEGLDTIEKLVHRLEKVQARINLKKDTKNKLLSEIVLLRENSKIIDKYKDIKRVEPLLKELSIVKEQIKTAKDIFGGLIDEILKVKNWRTLEKKGEALSFIEKKVKALETLREKRKSLEMGKESLTSSLNTLSKAKKSLRRNLQKVTELEESLPDVCPTCGQPLPKGVFCGN